MTRIFVKERFASTELVSIDDCDVKHVVIMNLPDAPVSQRTEETFTLKPGHVEQYVTQALLTQGFTEKDEVTNDEDEAERRRR